VAYGDIQRGSDSSDGSQGCQQDGGGAGRGEENRWTDMGGRKDARMRTTGKDEVGNGEEWRTWDKGKG